MRASRKLIPWTVRGAAMTTLLIGSAIVVRAQATQGSCTFTDENGKVVTLPNCGIPAAGASGGDQPSGGTQASPPAAPSPVPAAGGSKSFPFPGESSPAANPSGTGAVPAAPGSAQAPSSGANPASSGGSNQPAGQRFPFPGGDSPSSNGAKPAAPGGLQDAGSSGSSSSSAPGSSSSSGSSNSSNSSNADDNGAGPLAGDNDAAAKAAAAKHRQRLAAENAEPVQTDTQRESEDVRVASFYQNDGDYRGAYLRAKDAVSLADDDAEAHLELAEAARKLGKLDEAETNYKKCLTLDPVPRVKKAAEKALKEMQGGG